MPSSSRFGYAGSLVPARNTRRRRRIRPPASRLTTFEPSRSHPPGTSTITLRIAIRIRYRRIFSGPLLYVRTYTCAALRLRLARQAVCSFPFEQPYPRVSAAPFSVLFWMSYRGSSITITSSSSWTLYLTDLLIHRADLLDLHVYAFAFMTTSYDLATDSACAELPAQRSSFVRQLLTHPHTAPSSHLPLSLSSCADIDTLRTPDTSSSTPYPPANARAASVPILSHSAVLDIDLLHAFITSSSTPYPHAKVLAPRERSRRIRRLRHQLRYRLRSLHLYLDCLAPPVHFLGVFFRCWLRFALAHAVIRVLRVFLSHHANQVEL
jgi:hypothetical protein